MNIEFNCILCLEDIKNTNKQILCTKCNKSCCTTCFRTYMVHCRNDPPCPNPECEYVHGIAFLRTKLPHIFWDKEYKASRKVVLYDHEQMYKAATMQEVLRHKSEMLLKKYAAIYHSTKGLLYVKQSLFANMVFKYWAEYLGCKPTNVEKRGWRKGLQRDVVLYSALLHGTTTRGIHICEAHKKTLDDAAHEMSELRELLEKQSVDYANNTIQYCSTTIQEKHTPKPKYQIPCHKNGCAGLCMDSLCPVCSSKTCGKCHKKLENDHECNKDDIETVKEISKNSKPCPTCNEAISKVNGCNQMLCTSCHTVFHWQTGKIDTGRIHNPHYYEIRRLAGRELGDAICGGLVNWHILRHDCFECPRVKELRYTRDALVSKGRPIPNHLREPFVSEREMVLIGTHHQFISHIRSVIFPRLVNLDHSFHTNLKERLQYYMQEIDKSQFVKAVYRHEKQRTMHIELRDLIQTFVIVSEEIFRKIYDSKQVTNRHLPELKGVLEYLSEQYTKIALKYKSNISLDKFLKWKSRVRGVTIAGLYTGC